MDSFYLTLACDFDNQKPQAVFETELLDEVQLSGTWDVGLSDISFPKTWYNFSTLEDIRLLYFSFTAPNAIKISIGEDAYVPKNLYTLESLIIAMNNAIQNHFTKDNYLVQDLDIQMKTLPSVNFNSKTNNFVLCRGESQRDGFVYILPSLKLCDSLGYDYQELLVDVQELFQTCYLTYVKSNGDESGVLPNNLNLPDDDITNNT